MELLKVSTFTITRKAADATWVDGYPVQAADSVTSAFGNIQPAPAEMLEILSEADRKRDPKKVWSKTELKIGDILTVSAVRYEITQVSNWQQTGLISSHYESLALRITA